MPSQGAPPILTPPKNTPKPIKEKRLILLFIILNMVAASDITSISLGFGSIRLAWALLPIIYIFLPRTKENKFPLACAAALFLIHVIASFVSDDWISGIVYSAWIVVNYIYFFRSGYSIGKETGSLIWYAVLISGRIQILCGIIFVIFGLHERAQFFYFEPSYMAIGLIPYIIATAHYSNARKIDFLLIVALIAFTQSANLLIVIACAATTFLIAKRKIKSTIIALAIISPLIYYYLNWAAGNGESPNHYIAKLFLEEGLNGDAWLELINRAGNRFPRMQAAFDSINPNNFYLGMGPGRYTQITSNINFDHLTNGLEYLDPAGLPVVNVILELLTNAGILAAAIVVVFTAHLLIKSKNISDTASRRIVISSIATVAIVMQIESSYLRAYIWLYFGLFSGIAYSSASNKPKNNQANSTEAFTRNGHDLPLKIT